MWTWYFKCDINKVSRSLVSFWLRVYIAMMWSLPGTKLALRVCDTETERRGGGKVTRRRRRCLIVLVVGHGHGASRGPAGGVAVTWERPPSTWPQLGLVPVFFFFIAFLVEKYSPFLLSLMSSTCLSDSLSNLYRDDKMGLTCMHKTTDERSWEINPGKRERSHLSWSCECRSCQYRECLIAPGIFNLFPLFSIFF